MAEDLFALSPFAIKEDAQMLNRLIQHYNHLSTQAEALLQEALSALQEERAPSQENLQQLHTTLTNVQLAYRQVRDHAAQELPAEDLPDEYAPISAYTAFLESKRRLTASVLQEFLCTYTYTAHYEAALRTAQEKAEELLQAFQEDASAEPDVAPYKAFIRSIRLGEALESAEGDTLLDIVEGWDKKLARGLISGAFGLKDQGSDADSGHPSAPAVETDSPLPPDAPSAAPEEPAPSPSAPPSSQEKEEAPAAPPAETPAASGKEESKAAPMPRLSTQPFLEEAAKQAHSHRREQLSVLAASIRNAGSAEQRNHYLQQAYEAYAAHRQGVGSALLRALAQMHPEVHGIWQKWACASADNAYADGRAATRLQEIYADMDPSSVSSSALTISALLRMYFSNDAAKEYWVRSVDAISATCLLKDLSSLRELSQRLQAYVIKNQCGITEATLVSMRRESGVADQFLELQARASTMLNARLTETQISNKFMKNLLDLLFSSNSVLLQALRYICEDKRDAATQIRDQLSQIDPGLLRGSQPAIEGWVDELWYSPLKSGRIAYEPIKGHGRNIALSRTKNALDLINQWIDLCTQNDGVSEQALITAAAEAKHLAQILPSALQEVCAYRKTAAHTPEDHGALLILVETLAYFGALVRGDKPLPPGLLQNVELAACDAMALGEDSVVYILPAEDMVVPYEQCKLLEGILAKPPISLKKAASLFVERVMSNASAEGGNFGNGRYLLRCAEITLPSFSAAYTDSEYENRIKDATAIYRLEERKFDAHMEMAQGYGWITSLDEQDRIARSVTAQCSIYHLTDNFAASVDCMKRTFTWCRQTARSLHHDPLMADLRTIVKTYNAEENNATVVRIQKLIEQDCYTAATAEIRKIHKDGQIEDQSTATSESRYDFFMQNFQSYYSAVLNVNTNIVSIYNTRNQYNYKGYVDNGRRMLRAWPQSPEAISPNSVETILSHMQLFIENIVSVGKSSEGHVAVHFKPRTSMEFMHPIADFGTNMLEGGLDVFYLGGNKTAEQYFDTIRSLIGKSTEHSVLFLVNSAMSLSIRRQLTSKIWHEMRSARPLILLDRVLMLYLAENQQIDRWNVLLQCALPFTMVKPYTERSNAQQPPEMFVGRVRELQRLMSFGLDGANLVYGGRQLGKSAILYRIEQEMHDESKSTYVVLSTIKDMDAETAVRYILLAMQRKRVPDAQTIPLNSSWQDMCFALSQILTNHPSMKLMLLIDEADILLGKDKERKYAALSRIKVVQDDFGNRFKFIFAGLHNVMRLHNEALDNNSDLPKLSHVNIQPLDYTDAETLLKKPLSYMGFMFNESEEQQALISMILSTTNYYPGLIHYYCASLLNTFGDGHAEPAPTKPPYEFDTKLILKLLQKKEFMEQTKQKFMMTLGIDKDEHQYYSILAYLMAYCYDENDAQANGVSVGDICEAAEMTGITVISRLEASQVETLLDELCQLNILYCPKDIPPRRYVFSRPAFKDMLGTEDDVMEALLSYMDIEEVSQ